MLVTDSRRVEVIERVRGACAEGRQAYWVCTLIEESEELTCQAAETTYEDLTSALGELKVGLIHGRMKTAEKAAVMAQFKAGDLQLLVATTVIEVGGGRAQRQPDDHRKPRAPGPGATAPATWPRRPGQRGQPLRAAVSSAAVADRPVNAWA